MCAEPIPSSVPPRGSSLPPDLGRSAAMAIDARLQRERLDRFLAAMLPIAVAFDAVYLASAVWLRSGALAGGALAVAPYIAAVALARRRLAAGDVAGAALWTGSTLLVMVAIGAFFLHFLLAALVLIPLAGVALVLPYVRRGQLRAYLIAAVAVVCEVVALDGLMDPLFLQPPVWFQKTIVASAVIAATVLTVHLLRVDHERLHNLLIAAHRNLWEAEEANAAKDTFLAAAAHDLRTPLTALQLDVESLTRGPLRGEITGPRVRQRIERIERQTGRLVRLVTDLLDVSRIAGGRLELEYEPVEVAALVRETVARFDQELTRSGSDLRLALPERLDARIDRRRFEQIVTNLVGNAIKYGAGRPIEVCLRRDGGRLELVVRDEGIGIPVADQARVFERFERGASAVNYAGLGVGLWVVRELLQMMRGTIALASREGEGSTFTVRLPLER